MESAVVPSPEETLGLVTEVVSSICNVSPEEIGPDEPLSNYGIDSILMAVIVALIEQKSPYQIAPASVVRFFFCATTRDVSAQLNEVLQTQDRAPGASIGHS
jgi:acyl carrier protein